MNKMDVTAALLELSKAIRELSLPHVVMITESGMESIKCLAYTSAKYMVMTSNFNHFHNLPFPP